MLFTGTDEAVIFVKNSAGKSALMANLTNLAAWRADGTISSDEVLKTEWLRIEEQRTDANEGFDPAKNW